MLLYRLQADLFFFLPFSYLILNIYKNQNIKDAILKDLQNPHRKLDMI